MSRAISWDPGTMFFQVAEKNGKDIDIKVIRNSFVEMEATDDIEQVLEQNKWQYIFDGKKFYIIGEDSLKVAKMFPGKIELRRPMQDGVLNKGEEKKILVMTKMLEDVIGKAPDKESMVCFCVSSESVDNDVDNTFHKARLEGMVKRLGYNTKVIEEGHAVVLAERPVLIEADGTESPYSGIGISFGAGKVNCVLAYKGLPIIGMSATRCLSEDSIVLTTNGYKQIMDINIGDLVIDAYGNPVKVLNVINNGKKGTLLNLKLNNMQFINHKMTQDHLVLAKKEGQWDWVQAGNLEVGDIVGESVVQFDKGVSEFYYGFDKKNKKGLKGRKSRNLGRIVGLFLGDGSVNMYKTSTGKEAGYIQWAFNINDIELIEEYIEIISSYFNKNVSIDYIKRDNLVLIKLHSTSIARNFKKKFYSNNGIKTCGIPLNQITNQMALGIIQGLIDSDGNINNRDGYDFNNTSLDLIILIHQMLGRFGIKHSIMEREPRLGGVNKKGEQIIGRKKNYVVRISGFGGESFRLLLKYENRGLPIQIYDKMEYLISEVKIEEYGRCVYDLSVESNHHSFNTLGMIVHNCGDYIDKKVAEQTDTPIAQVTSIKEKKLDFNNIDYDNDVIFALDAYYTNMIEYVFKNFSIKFQEVKSQFDAPLDIVIAGGTSMPKGFINKVKSVVHGLDLPFMIKEVKQSSDARNAVVKGCLTQAIISQKKLKSSSADKMLE